MSESERIEEFKKEVEELQVTGGQANPEKRLLTLGVVFGSIGIILVVAAFLVSRSSDALGQRDMFVMAILGATLTVVGAVLYVTNKLTRFFRYWLVRLIYEHRAQTDRLTK